MRFIHVADTHLGYRQYNLEERERDIYNLFNDIFDIALEERVDAIIHSGDLFDTPRPTVDALYEFRKALKKIEGKIKFITVLGEHDTPKRRGKPPQDLFDIHILGRYYELSQIIIDDVLIAGISNIKLKNLEILKRELKKFDKIAKVHKNSVLVIHQAIKKFLPFEGAYQLVLADLPETANYYALGHIHSRQMEKFGNGILAYSGSIEIMNKDEISSWKNKGKGVYLVDLEGDEPQVETINLNVRPQYNIITKVDDLESALNKVDLKYKPIIHVEVVGEKLDKKRLTKQISDMLGDKVLSYRPIFRETFYRDIKASEGPIDYQAIFADYFKDEKKSKLALELHELLSNNDIKSAIKIAENFLNEDKGE